MTPKKTRFAYMISRITTWTLRLMAVAVVLFFIAVIVSANMGGNGEIQRRSLEKVLSSIFQDPARVHALNMYRIFPTQYVDFEDMVVIRPDEKEPRVLVHRVQYVNDPIASWMGALPIVHIAFDHFLTRPGVLGPYSLHLKEGRIVPPVDSGGVASFVMKGNYGPRDLVVRMPMQAEKKKDKWTYRFLGTAPIQIHLGTVDLVVHMQILKDKVLFHPFEIMEGDGIYTGSLAVSRAGSTEHTVVLKLSDDHGNVLFDGPLDKFNRIAGYLDLPAE